MRHRIGLNSGGPGRFNDVSTFAITSNHHLVISQICAILSYHTYATSFAFAKDLSPQSVEQAQNENGGTAPMPGSQLWMCMLFTSTDMSKSGSCGGHMLDPPLFLGIPVAIVPTLSASNLLFVVFRRALLIACSQQPTVCLSDHHKGGLQYATLYTDVDGYVYRGSAGKDKAIEWITRMRTR